MLKNVIFDFGGVVCTFSQDAILDDFCTGEVHARLKPVLFRSWQALDEGTADYEEYVAETLKLLDGEDKQIAQRFFREWHRSMRPIPGIWALIGELKARGYGVYLLSNASTWFAGHLDDYPILRLFDGRLISDHYYGKFLVWEIGLAAWSRRSGAERLTLRIPGGRNCEIKIRLLRKYEFLIRHSDAADKRPAPRRKLQEQEV